MEGAPTSHLFLMNKASSQLKIYQIPANGTIYSQKELDLTLSQTINNFPYKTYNTYYYFNEVIHFLDNGDVKRINLSNGNKFSYDTKGYITQFRMIDGQSIFTKDKFDRVYFLDLSLLNFDFDNPKAPKCMYMSQDVVGRALIRPLFTNSMPSFQPKIEGDQFNCASVLFIDPYKVACIPNLSDPFISCDSSYSFASQTLGFNSYPHIISPSEFNHFISCLQGERGLIKTWNLGSGKVTQIKQLDADTKSLLKDFKYFSQWDDYNIARRQEYDGFAQFIKFKVAPQEVKISCIFKHQHTLGNNLFVSSDNNILLEYDKLIIQVSQLVLDDEGIYQTKTLFMMRNKYPNFQYPLYFTADFTKYMEFTNSKFICFYSIPQSQDKKQFIKKEYVKVQAFNVPAQTKIFQDKQSGLFMIEFESSNRIRFVNNYNIEQIIPIDRELENQADLIKERNVQGQQMGLDFFSRFRDIQRNTRQLQKLENLDLIQIKSLMVQARTQTDCSSLAIENKDHIRSIAIPNNMKVLQSFTFMDWRLLRQLSNGELDIKTLSRFTRNRQQQLLTTILPSGETFIHLLVQSNGALLEELLCFLHINHYALKFLPDLKGITPLHYCVRDQQTINATKLLKVLSETPLNNHAQYIQSLLPELLQICPMALGDYLDARLIQIPWTPAFTEGKLRHEAGSDFAVVPMNLYPLNEQVMKQNLFDSNEKFGDIKLPLNVVLSDIPDLHMIGSRVGQEFLKQLSSIKHSTSLFSKRYIQALVEIKWPPIRRALMIQIFLPYLIYLALFNYYALFLVYEPDYRGSFTKVTVEIMLLALTLHAMTYEVREYRAEPEHYLRHFWNYLDVLPKIVVLFSMALELFGELFIDPEISDALIQKLNSISIFCLWINILNYLRLFRKTGYLIHLIIQVIIDMKYFLMIVGITLLSFSSTFYILSRSNTQGGDFLEGSYINANTFIYQLLLGQFNPDDFGPTNLGLTWFFFVLATLFLIVVMLNLLISIISATFSEVQSQAKERMYFEFAQMIVENYHLLTPATIRDQDRRGKYLYLAWLEESVTVDERETQDQAMREYLQGQMRMVVKSVRESIEEGERAREGEIAGLVKKIGELQAEIKGLKKI